MLHGVLPVLLTPFTDTLDLDLPALQREIDWVIDHGADGVVMGMVSETLRLSSTERDRLAEATCAAADGRVPVVTSVGAESQVTAVAHARAAAGYGAAAVMAIPPMATDAGEDEVFRYYAAIVEAIDIPVVVQDASGYLGNGLSIALQANLHRQFGSRVCFKPEAQPIGPKLSALRDATGATAVIYEGSGGVALVDSYARGIAGTMPGADIVWAIAALWRALVDGDEAAVNRLNGPISTLVLLQSTLDAYVAVQKHLLVRQGVIPSAAVRGPVGYILDPESEREVDRLFDHLRAAVAG
ncbi:dihydrodipicolinate synthase family protein [Actinoplanes sp. NBRC 103695]|uniref:dihydrodipicolinate synthase family protein n=1 Tax=Actinoplanes sp. NBRC 103695 TaxID=3032202 RepID=UPI0024A2C449|nr:dihydrodipicolinate synthase family protein [Actinoplanes sp. NBRC 103695]GLZ00991.1 dihydrodipicolinate synthase family protein [Actinoplanes sp. NBRC 103695]